MLQPSICISLVLLALGTFNKVNAATMRLPIRGRSDHIPAREHAKLARRHGSAVPIASSNAAARDAVGASPASSTTAVGPPVFLNNANAPYATRPVNGSAVVSLAATVAPGQNAWNEAVAIGSSSQSLVVDFDTGSTDFWVIPATGLSGGFNVQADSLWSNTSASGESPSLDILYGDGEGVYAYVGFSQVVIGGVTATSQAIGIATQFLGDTLANFQTDQEYGVVGLATDAGSRMTPQQPSFFNNLKDQLDEQLFSVDFSTDGTGSITFGSNPSDQYSGAIAWQAQDLAMPRYWTVTSSNMVLSYTDGTQLAIGGSSPQTLFDIGTTYVFLDVTTVWNYYLDANTSDSDINGLIQLTVDGLFSWPCDESLFPTPPQLMLGFPDLQLPFDPVWKRLSTGTCLGTLQSNAYDGSQSVVGELFFQSAFVSFDSGNQRLGIAAKAT